MLRTSSKSLLAPLLVIAVSGLGSVSEIHAETNPSPPATADAVILAQTATGQSGAGQAPSTPGGQSSLPPADGSGSSSASGNDGQLPDDGNGVQSTSGMAQEATRPNSLFPAWSLRATRGIDPRIRPNAGLRTRISYFPIEGGPLLYPNFTPVEPDFVGGEPTNNWAIRQSVALFGVEDDHVSSKFQEFRDVRSGVTAGIEGHYRSGNTFLNLVGRQLGRKDQDMILDGGVAGTYQYAVAYNETPHNYAFDARSLWGGMGTEYLTLPNGMRADLQNSVSNADYAAKLLGYVYGGSEFVDLSLHRQSIGAELSVIATYPFVLKASVSNESRDGVRPWSASFGFGTFVELPWPVKYDTQELRLVAEYAKPESRVYASASYRFSNFIDHIQNFTFDNPGRLVDAAGNLNCIFACGPATGRMALYPSNQYHEISGVLAIKKLPFNSTFNAYVSAGFMRQDEELQPFATNSADPPMRSPVSPAFNATDITGVPRDTAESAMTTQTVSMRWTSEFNKKTRLVGQYRYYGLGNDQTPFTMYQFVREDEDIRNPETVGGTYTTVPAEYSKHTATVEGTYEFSPMRKASAVYTFERMNREHREVEWMNDHKLKLEYDAVLFGSLELKSWVEHTKRSTSEYDFDQYNIYQGNPIAHPMVPWLLKLDEAPYDRNELQVMATYALNDTSTFSSHVQFVDTDFNATKLAEESMTITGVVNQTRDDMQFGLRKERSLSLGLDYMWAPSERWTLFAEAGLERRQSEAMARQWSPAGVSNPYLRQTALESNSNWIVDVHDNYYTAGLGGDATIIPKKLKLTVQYVYGQSNGRHDYFSPVGTAADDQNVFEPQPFDDVDDTTTHSFNPELSYEYSDRITLAAGYQYEKWNINDYIYKGFTYVPLYTTGVAMLMGGLLPQPYSSNIAYVRVKMGF